MEHKGPVLRSRWIGPGRARTQIPFNSIQGCSMCRTFFWALQISESARKGAWAWWPSQL